jgi:hypothetical protein
LWIWGKSTVVCESDHVLAPKRFTHFGEDHSVLKVVASSTHTLALTNRGETYAWGDNRRGQLGVAAGFPGHNERVRFPELVKSIPGRPDLLATGPFHTICYLTCKEMVGWGDQSCGRLGIAQPEDTTKEKIDLCYKAFEDVLVAQKSATDDQGVVEKVQSIVREINDVLAEHTEAKQVVAARLRRHPWFEQNRQSVKWQASDNRIKMSAIINASPRERKQKHIKEDFGAEEKEAEAGAKGQEQKKDNIIRQPENIKAVWASVEAITTLMCPERRKMEGKNYKSKAAAHANRCVIQALRKGQDVTSFATMQTLLKLEPADAKIDALKLREENIIRQLQDLFREVGKLPEMECKVRDLQKELDYSFCANLSVLKRGAQHDSEKMGNRAISPCIGRYQELLWLLQQQVAYLGTLSEHLTAQEDIQTLLKSVDCIFEELDDSRTFHHLVALMKMLIEKEVNSAKCLEDLCGREKSRFFLCVFRDFALRPIHHEQVVHKFMDIEKETILGSIVGATRQDIAFAFSRREYLSKKSPLFQDLSEAQLAGMTEAQLASHLSEQHHPDSRQAMYAFTTFMKTEFLHALAQRCKELHPNIAKIFAVVMQAVKKRQPVDADPEWYLRWGVSQEEHVHEPLLKLLVWGILVPLLDKPDFFGGAAVGLGGRRARQEDMEGSDLLKWNTRVVKDFLVKMVMDKFSAGENLAKIVADESIRPAMLKLLMELADSTEDDTDTELVVSLFTSHFDRTKHTLSVPSSLLMKLSNLLKKHEAALDLTDEVSLEEVLADLKVWDARAIREAEADDVIYNFDVNNRFLFKERDVTICYSSNCLVPARLVFSGTDSRVVAGAAGIVKRIDGSGASRSCGNPRDPCKKLEEVLFSIRPLDASSFQELHEELENAADEYNIQRDFVLVTMIKEAISIIEEVIQQEFKAFHLLDHMAQKYLERNRHMHYLRRLSEGLTRIQTAKEDHKTQLESAEDELEKAYHFSLCLRLPEQLTSSVRLRLDKKLAFKQIEKRIEYLNGYGRDRRAKIGLSHRPTQTFTLKKLMDRNVIKSVLMAGLEEEKADVKLTFTLGGSGVDINVSVEQRQSTEVFMRTVGNIQLSDERLQLMQHLEKHQLVTLPTTTGNPIFECNCAALLALVSKIAKG